MQTSRHDAEVQDQFTKQADSFFERHAHRRDGLLELMAECAQPRPTDTLLDVACGPGIISCFFAVRVRSVIGLDAVPAMLDRARRLQSEKQLSNIEWKLGQATDLPFADGSFDCALSRFSFHHFEDPRSVLLEMKRVTKSEGTILVADVTPRPEAQSRFNEWEILRDPSHTRALTIDQLRFLGEEAGLALQRQANFSHVMQLESVLGGSFPRLGDAAKIRALFQQDIHSGCDDLGVSARLEDEAITIVYPVSILTWRKQK